MKLRAQEPSKCEIEMTPLIDCVFLLILFFLLTTKMTVEIEEVGLPFAMEGVEAQTGNPGIVPPLVINVVVDNNKPAAERAGIIRFGGADVTEAELTQKLTFEARYDAEHRGRGWERGPGENNPLSKLEVVLRADKAVGAKYARQVFQACAKAKIFKVQLGSIEPQS